MTTTPPKTPGVAIARVLRGFGLTQGRGCDFRITGDYRNGERIGTYVLPLTRRANDVIAEHADEIEAQAAATGFAFRVSVRYHGSPRPAVTVANYGSSVREAPPAPPALPAEPEAATEPAPAPDSTQAAPARTPEPAPDLPPADTTAARVLEGARERAWQRQQVRALGWSAGQADLMAAAGSVQLLFDQDDVLRHYPRPGWAGHTIALDRLTPLLKAGFLIVTEPYGPGSRRVSTTADGRDALLLWRRWRPTPMPKDRQQDREPLRPLLGGELAARRAEAEDGDSRLRAAQSEAWFAALQELHDWEDRDERLWKAWAAVQDITHRLGRRWPRGWVPTPEEVARHRISPEVVAELEAEAGRPTAKPNLPAQIPLRPLEIAPLTAAPGTVEQLDLFGQAA
ncbi:hypothetical protein ACFY0G_17585 [Streptomyces sp. NPDC001552]|uniref:hypothetical protein n=1 Tax=Streptomyces sp. NPDC001552 TaxID=3364587 RepID=UPI0036A38048